MPPAYAGQPQLYSFTASQAGAWAITRIEAVAGESLAPASRLAFQAGEPAEGATWTLSGFTSNARYTTRAERDGLTAAQAPLARAEARCAALIPIRKSPAWWTLAQDERRAIMEETSHHIAIGREYLPAIARQLHHCRDLGEPFDFLTWFEFTPEHEAAFDELVARLRTTEEWRYVEREVDVRLAR
jgi:chlorite dismutase